MRLVCPNCEAKYEVPEDAIPETGRDVQCANCGHAWYQMRARAAVVEAPLAPAPVVAAPVAPAPVPEVVSAPAPVVEAAPEPVPEPVPEPEVAAEPAVEAVPDPVPEPEVVAETVPEAQSAPEPVPEPEAGAPVAEDAEAEPSTTPEGIEAVVEASPSAAEPVSSVEVAPESAPDSAPDSAVETVADPVADAASAEPGAALPELDDANEAASVAAQAAAAGAAAAASAPAAYAVDDSVLAILREEAEREVQARRAESAKPLEVQEDLGIDTAMPDARSSEIGSVEPAAATMAASRTRLPDVEEIKSTLRPDETLVDSAEANGAAPVEGRSSFRKGFSLVIVLAILGAALYVSADSLKAAVPALAGVLDAYVGFVDGLRLQLDGLMQSATLAINGN